MAALTSDRDTQERIPQQRTLESAGTIYAGALVAVNASGKAVPASDTAGLTVVGRAQHPAKTGEKITVKVGCFAYDAASGVTFTAADAGSIAYVTDDHTVDKSGGTNKIVAGIVYDVDEQGVWIRIADEAQNSAGTIDNDTTYDAATADTLGLVKQAAAVADCTAAGDNAVSVETQFNALLAALRTAGIIAAE